MTLRIAIGTDHGGFEAKEKIAATLQSEGYGVMDFGTFSCDSTDYPIFAARVSQAVSTGNADRGIIVCRTGNGMAMVANRHAGVRAALCVSEATAKLAREHNDANVLVLAADHSKDDTAAIVTTFLGAKFEGGRHARRVDMIKELDRLAYSPTTNNRLVRAGQSPWLDDMSDQLITSGQLAGLVKDTGLRGMTSNPTIFEKSISTGKGHYRAALEKMREEGVSVDEAYERLTLHDITRAADIMRPVYDASGGDDGFVSLEVAPKFGDDEEGTVAEALRLFKLLDRPNVMIKIPGTTAGIRAFQRVTAAGVNVNVTLLFSLSQYEAVARAYIAGLHQRQLERKAIHHIRSVASVFVSRIDVVANKLLDEALKSKQMSGEMSGLVARAKNEVAIANTQKIYELFRSIFFGSDFADLLRNGAAVQRPLWASTGVKDASLRDVLYVERLVAPYTVNTMPEGTMNGMLDHGVVDPCAIFKRKLSDNDLALLAKEANVDLEKIGAKLQADGLTSFAKSFDDLYATITKALTGELATA